jgi:hypothetical protein
MAMTAPGDAVRSGDAIPEFGSGKRGFELFLSPKVILDVIRVAQYAEDP